LFKYQSRSSGERKETKILLCYYTLQNCWVTSFTVWYLKHKLAKNVPSKPFVKVCEGSSDRQHDDLGDRCGTGVGVLPQCDWNFLNVVLCELDSWNKINVMGKETFVIGFKKILKISNQDVLWNENKSLVLNLFLAHIYALISTIVFFVCVCVSKCSSGSYKVRCSPLVILSLFSERVQRNGCLEVHLCHVFPHVSCGSYSVWYLAVSCLAALHV
jgi:hypothetical protein